MTLKPHQLIGYGFLSSALAFIGLPLYVYLPKYYTQDLGVSLTFISFILLFSRAIDAIQDPLIGWVSDRMQSKRRRYILISLFSPLLLFSFYGLLFPPTWWRVELWICLLLIFTYTSFSFISINYSALAPEITHDYNLQTKLVSTREGMGLFGIAVGSVLPTLLLQVYPTDTAHDILWLIFAVIFFIGLYLLFRYSPWPELAVRSTLNIKETFKSIWKEKSILNLYTIYIFSTIAASIPAATVLFYIEDVIGDPSNFGYYLAFYFISAIAAVPFWYFMSKKIGKKSCWILGTFLTIFSFFWASILGPGDSLSYLVICFFTGIAVGADLTMPVAMLGDILPKDSSTAKFFGVWTMIGKSSIALAGSIALFTLSQLGYEPSGAAASPSEIKSLQIVYALVPCGFKLIALILLLRSSLDQQHSRI